MKQQLRQFADGILFQFLMVGSLSFSHIHDVVAAHGQAGWKSWLYPLSVDLLTVAAFRKLRNHDGGAFTWLAFLLGLSASLAANVIDSWTATPVGRALAVAIGVWPAVALLVCTLLAHDDATATVALKDVAQPVASRDTQSRPTVAPATQTPVARPVAPTRPVAPATPARPVPATVAASSSRRATVTSATAATSKKSDATINRTVLRLLAEHGENLSGPTVAEALGLHRSRGPVHLKRVKAELADGKLDTHPEAPRAKAALSSSLSSSPQTTTANAT